MENHLAFIKELSRKQHCKTDIQELVELVKVYYHKHLQVQQGTADAFNKYFSPISDKISKNNVANTIIDETLSTFRYYLEQKDVHHSSSLVFKIFPTKEITSIIKSLITNNSHGYNISTNLLKISATYVCSLLLHICNKSILSGILSNRWKFSIIEPI